MSGHPPSASQQEELSEEAQKFWLQWVEAAFPDLDSRTYFLPPVHFHREPMTRRSIAGQSTHGQSGQSTPGETGQSNQPTMAEAHPTDPQPKESQNDPDVQLRPKNPGKVKPSLQDSDVRDDASLQRIFCCLKKMSEENREVLVGLSQLQFGQYLGEPCYAAAAGKLPASANLPSVLSQNWKEGDFDVLLIHRHYGLVVCEVKTFGDNVQKLNMSQQDIDNNIRKKLTDAVLQLDKAEAMLSHLVSDVIPGLRITKTIAVPNLTACQVQQAISGDPLLTWALCRCLETADSADITALCLCSDHLSDPKTPWDVSSDVLRELDNWWQRRVDVSGTDSHMTCDVYKTLVARFCGPATLVTVSCTFLPRLCVKTLGQAVSLTGEFYTAHISLFPEQIDLLNTEPPRVFLTGPPGTGKTVVLLLMATEWLRCGSNVYIISSWWKSRAACIMLYHLLLQIANTMRTSGVALGRPCLLEYELYKEYGVEKAVNDLSKVGKRWSLYVIADEAVESRYFQTFCDKLLTQVRDLHLWAASCYHGYTLAGWQVENLTRPLRCPPAVTREVQLAKEITETRVQPYSQRDVPDHTDGQPVTRLYHRGQGHSGRWPYWCVTCGREVASFLRNLRALGNNATFTSATTTSGSTTSPCLQWRDVLVLCSSNVSDQSGLVRGLKESGIPVQVMENDDIEDVATARSDVVWVADGDLVRGLERKVIVCVDDSPDQFYTVRLHFMSRCTSQLVIVSP